MPIQLRSEELIVTSVNPTQIVECMNFDDKSGQNQLLCILQGESTSFKISCHEDGSCDITKRKIRFVNQTLFQQIQNIQCQENESVMGKFCTMLVEEISEGRVLFEQKHKNGQVEAIASPTVARLLQNGGLVIRNKKGNVKTYDKIKCAGASFFKQIAQAFAVNLQAIVQQNAQFVKQNQLIEKTSPAGVRVETEQQIIRSAAATKSIWDYLIAVKDSILKIFDPETSAEKIQEKYLAHEREQLHIAHKRDIERKEREKDVQRYERKRDDVRYEIKSHETTLSSRKQEERLFSR